MVGSQCVPNLMSNYSLDRMRPKRMPGLVRRGWMDVPLDRVYDYLFRQCALYFHSDLPFKRQVAYEFLTYFH